jgi:glycerophosphoryl diester phosphodiesterase
MNIITHRGINISDTLSFSESTYEAFSNQLESGFGLEFDLQITKDKQIFILHDSTLTRISNGTDTRKICDIFANEIFELNSPTATIISLNKLLDLITEKQSPYVISAMHVKHNLQNKESLAIILQHLQKHDLEKFILFDVTVESAHYLKEQNKSLLLAPSLAHPFDIQRYNDCVGSTLTSLEDFVQNKTLFDWVWLDEWDRLDKDNMNKKFYTPELFKTIRDMGIKIALVTPELHATSPGLLGQEKHSDAINEEKLFDRIEEIIQLQPDIICTDYASRIKSEFQKNESE